MGKRELVLIAIFVVLGVIVYQFTAAPLAPGQQGFSLGRMVQTVRRGVAGGRAHATVETTRTEALDPATTELRVNVRTLNLTVAGEDRADVAFDLKVDSNGIDEADAKRLASAAVLKFDRGGGLGVSIEFPADGSQQAALTIRMPRRVALRVENKSGPAQISNVASADIRGNRGDTTVTSVPGAVTLAHFRGALKIDEVGSLRLTGIGGSGTIAHVRGTTSVDVVGSDLTFTDITGPLDLKGRTTDVRLRGIEALKGPLRLDMQAGLLEIDGLRVETRVDGRGTEMRLGLARAVPLTVYNTGEDISVTPAPGGYTLDAIATDGDLRIEDGSLKPSGDDREKRAAGPVRGGGPTITLRTTRGNISVKKSGAQQ
jgi:hypothetical protein